jgi:hypothetical protein
VCLTKFYFGDHSKKHEIDKACGTKSRQERYKVFWQEDMWERDHLEDLGVDSIMLKWIFKKCGRGFMEWIHLAVDRDS